MATPDYDQVLKNNQEAASLSAKAAQEARDAYTQIINTKVVGTSGQLRALSAADTLAEAPVGDAAKLRSNIGIRSAGTMGSSPSIYGPDLKPSADEVATTQQLLDVLQRSIDVIGVTSTVGASSVVHSKTIDAKGGVIIAGGDIGSVCVASRLFSDPGITALWGEVDGSQLRPCTNGSYYPGTVDLRLSGVWICCGIATGADTGINSTAVWRRIR